MRRGRKRLSLPASSKFPLSRARTLGARLGRSRLFLSRGHQDRLALRLASWWPQLPSPTTTKGAQFAGCASFGSPASMIATMDRRRASERPTDLSVETMLKALVMSLTVLLEFTAQCETSRERAPA